MDRSNRQTMNASPAKPEGLPLSLDSDRAQIAGSLGDRRCELSLWSLRQNRRGSIFRAQIDEPLVTPERNQILQEGQLIEKYGGRYWD